MRIHRVERAEGDPIGRRIGESRDIGLIERGEVVRGGPVNHVRGLTGSVDRNGNDSRFAIGHGSDEARGHAELPRFR